MTHREHPKYKTRHQHARALNCSHSSEITVHFQRNPHRERLATHLLYAEAGEWGGLLITAPNRAFVERTARSYGRPVPIDPIRVWLGDAPLPEPGFDFYPRGTMYGLTLELGGDTVQITTEVLACGQVRRVRGMPRFFGEALFTFSYAGLPTPFVVELGGRRLRLEMREPRITSAEEHCEPEPPRS